MTDLTPDIPDLLIEEWLPIRELGIESVRERQAASALPPLSFLHIWWARRPLAGCQGVQLATLLPAWEQSLLSVDGVREALSTVVDRRTDLEVDQKAALSDEDRYRMWVLWLSGVWGDTVKAEHTKNEANAAGIRLDSNPFTWKQAYKNKPSNDDLNVLHRLLIWRWGRLPHVLDPTAGGGSIPFTSQRYGLPSYANDLNPVAVGVLEASLKAPAEHGPELVADLKKWGGELVDRLTDRLQPYFQLDADNESVVAYVWVNTIACPRTGGPVPLAPNWWLSKRDRGTAVVPETVHNPDGTPSHIHYRITDDVKGEGIDPSEGTISRGVAVSPWDGLTIESDHIKAEAQAGQMWPELYAIACKRPKPKGRGSIRYFREPSATDLAGVQDASAALAAKEAVWAAEDVLPYESIPDAMNDRRPRTYGMDQWRKFYTDRQLLVHGTFVEEWRKLRDELVEAMPEGRGRAIATVIAAGFQNKSLNWNSKSSSWNVNRQGLRSVFDRHDFAFKWTFAEFRGAEELWGWCLDQLTDAYGGIADLMQPLPDSDDSLLGTDRDHPVPANVTVSAGSATDLRHLDDKSIECVNVDPPYYDNVQYAELADYFYVWEKRTLGTLHPDRFSSELTDKDNEAVTNPARFDFAKGKKRKQLADADYESKMGDIFTEARRVMTDDGALVVWFTHKRADAWDTLGAALMDAGFTIETSWPVNTESANSLHQANVNAAKSTIVLVCRKRLDDGSDGTTFFEDVEADLRAAARAAVREFEKAVGHGGVDLLLSTYGPTLSVLSKQWPVYRSEADAAGNLVPIRPEEALDIARAEVSKLYLAGLAGRERRFDPTTDFVVLAWSMFADVGFPYDEARKLAMGVGADVDDLISGKVLSKRGSNVSLVAPEERVARRIKTEGPFANLYDGISVLLRHYRTDGSAWAKGWLTEQGYASSQDFKEALLALANAVPRVKDKDGNWTLPLAGLIDEVATNVTTLGLRLADPHQQHAGDTAEQFSLDL